MGMWQIGIRAKIIHTVASGMWINIKRWEDHNDINNLLEKTKCAGSSQYYMFHDQTRLVKKKEKSNKGITSDS